MAAHLAAAGDVRAVLGLGSAGVEHDRFDDHSDLDFFVVTDDGATRRYLDDLTWLSVMGDVAYSFANERHGRKALYSDGLLVEYAVFTLGELLRLPFAGARVVWARPGEPSGPLTSNLAPPSAAVDTIGFHLDEALTNLLVGLHREQRGERLTAMRFIQVHAVDRITHLLRLTGTEPERRDPFDLTRRVETAYGRTLPLAEMAPGYAHNLDAARATLTWLTSRFDPDPALVRAVEELLEQA